MIIAVNAVTPAFKPAANSFFQDVFIKMAQEHPGHQFILIGFTAPANCPDNCTILQPAKTIKSPLGFLYWLYYRLPALLKKYKAAILFSYNSSSLRLKIPQLLYADDAAFLLHPGWYKTSWLRFYKKNTPKFLQQAAHIITASAFLQNELTTHYRIDAVKISTVHAAAAELFQPVTHWNMKELMKDKLTGGKEYFLYSGPLNSANNLINLLKAFTFFKQRQKSNMLLVLASTAAAEQVFVKSLASYKYRSEVVLAENTAVSELAAITAAAYAFVYPVMYDAAGTPVLQALQCDTPVIVPGTAAMPEICGDAAAYCDAADFNDIAAKMMLLFTNEDRRNLLIAKGRDHIRLLNSSQPAGQLWQLMEQFAKA
jgi:glycosyltransferase involved in cell wall biosynthesis